MPSYDYKAVEWSKFDEFTPIDYIQTETTGNWEYYDSIDIHPGRVDLIFRRPAGGA